MSRGRARWAATLALVGCLLLTGQPIAGAGAGGVVLGTGEVLTAEQQITSPDGRFVLRMQGDGNVVLYGPSGATWASRTSTPGTRLVAQADGNLVAYTTTNAAVWNTGTAGRSARLVVQDDGNAVLYDERDRPLWASGTAVAPRPPNSLTAGQRLDAGQRIASPGGRHVLVMQSDGNLVLYGPTGASWSTSTGTPGTSVIMQGDGNLVAYAPSGVPVWQTRSGGNPGSRVVLQDDGNLVVYRADGLPGWYPSSPVPAGADVGPARQVVGAWVGSPASTTGTLAAWSLGPTGWTTALPARPAWFGAAGVGQGVEGVARTPAGTYGITSAFGRNGDPGTALPYRVIDTQDWWVSDSGSPLYNQYTRCAAGSCPFDERAGENLWAQGVVYRYAAVVDYNPARVPGAGSAIFLHVSNGAPTAGCVALDEAGLVSLLRWLDPAARPVVFIGVR